MLRLYDMSLEPLLRSRKLGANALRALHMPPVRKAIQYIIRSTTFQYSLHVSTYPSQNSCCEGTSTSQHELSFQLLAATCRSSSSCSSNCELYSYIPKLATTLTWRLRKLWPSFRPSTHVNFGNCVPGVTVMVCLCVCVFHQL